MTVYESEDHHYVIKFFNPRSVIKENWFHRIPKLMRINSWKWISNTYFRQKERLEKYFYRYEMSFSDLKEETALIYIHLDPGTSLSQSLKLVDKKGIHHLLNLETHPFILQKKVDLTFTHLNKLIKAGQVEEAKEATRQIYSFFLSRAQKGYKDRFQALEKNYGFIEGKFVQFDTGRLRKDEAVFQNPYPETKRIILNIKPSLFNFPELLEVLDTCLKLELK
ncbi:MAG: hypothetical protein ACRDFB_00735 [Rhabdochlamydiaceae bacterium]